MKPKNTHANELRSQKQCYNVIYNVKPSTLKNYHGFFVVKSKAYLGQLYKWLFNCLLFLKLFGRKNELTLFEFDKCRSLLGKTKPCAQSMIYSYSGGEK